MMMLQEFIEYLKAQIGEPYVWGGQHTKLTPENYKAVIAKRESIEANRERVEAYCEKKFAEGETILFAYDCSGLGCWWIYNLKHLYRSDCTADTMMHRCKLTEDLPKRGYWLFKLSGRKATHIGYMVTDAELIEAGGRDVGVQERAFRDKDWSCWGIPLVFEKEIEDPEPVPTDKHVKVIGGSVNVRNAANTSGRVIYVAHRGDKLPYIDTAATGWYHVRFKDREGYITNLEKYTRLED